MSNLQRKTNACYGIECFLRKQINTNLKFKQMENNRKKCKVIMLPTEDNSTLFKGEHSLHVNPSEHFKSFLSPQHLYITTDDEIKEGDWFYNSNMNRVAKCSRSTVLCDAYYKIIATTDPKLKYPAFPELDNTGFKSLPQPSQAFIEKYCKVGGIDEIDVEYERNTLSRGDWITRLKIDSKNTITIHPIKYNRLPDFLFDDAGIIRIGFVGASDVTKEWNKWIEENL